MRIVLSNFGTLGDVNPLIALSLELKRRGHVPILAVPEIFRSRIEPLGLGFFPVRPEQDASNKDLVAMVYDIKKGTEYGLREFLFPAIRQSYDDLLAAVEADGGADLLLTGELAYAGPLVAEKTGIRWASYVLAPFSFFSAFDPPILPPYPTLAKVQAVVPRMGHVVSRFARHVTRHWSEPIFRLRHELGLSRGKNPIFDAKHSEHLVLALFSPTLGKPQPDWPASTRITGFVFYDSDAGQMHLAPEITRFLDAGPPPVVFTLGSAAVLDAGDFYEQSALAAQEMGQRAVLLIGNDPQNIPAKRLPEHILVAKYAPYSQLFPRASVIVHQGGVGTTAQAMRAGKPMLVMPYSHDQPDNAGRVRRLGIARVMQRSRYQASGAARVIGELLRNPEYAARALAVQREVQQEQGLIMACDALEEMAAR